MSQTKDELGSFGTLLRAFRKRRHLTQQYLADALGTHRQTVLRWEEGDFLPASKTMVLELAGHLHLDDRETRQFLEASLTALAPYWHVPFGRNPFFTGREEILEALHTRLSTDQRAALTQAYALHGLGGVGKTQIVLEYAYRHALEYSAVFWIGAETDEQIVASLLCIAEALQVPGRNDRDQQRVVAAVQHWLSTHGQWLLIWDNVEDLTILDRFLPSTRSGAILITTCCQALGMFAHGLDLLPMEQEEGRVFLLRRAKVLGPEATGKQVRQFAARMPSEFAAAEELVSVLGGLPLALDQAGAYIEETGCGLAGYLRRYEQQRHQLLDRRGSLSGNHPQSVVATLGLSYDRVSQQDPAALQLLCFCAFVSPDALPEESLLLGSSHLGPVLGPVAANPSRFDLALATLRRFSLVQRHAQTRTLSFHRLVQVVLQGFLPEAVQRAWRRRVLRVLNQLFPSDEKIQADYWQSGERLLPHALLCLTWSEEEALRLTLMSHVATYLSECSRYAQAEALYRQVVDRGEQALGAGHPQVGAALCGLANLHRRRGDYTPETEALYRRAVRLGEQALGADHPQVGAALHELASFYCEQGKYAQAEPLFQRALFIREQTLGADHRQVAAVLNNLAADYLEQGQHAQAEPLLRRALQIWEQALGPDHRRVAEPLNCLAVLSQEQGRYAEAEALFQRALAIREQQLGEDHPETAQTLHDQALFHQKQGHLSEALSLAERALQIRFQALGDEHPKTVVTRALSIRLAQEQDDAEQEELAQRSAKAHQGQFGKERSSASASAFLHETTNVFPAEDDSFQGFLIACCELHPLAWCRIRELWHTYERWTATEQGRVPLPRRAFAAQLEARGCRVDRTNTARIWRGIRLVSKSL